MLKLHTDYSVYDGVQLRHTVAGLSITRPRVPFVVMALIAGADLTANGAVLSHILSTARCQCEPTAAVTAIDVSHQQGLPARVERDFIVVCPAVLQHLLRSAENIIINDTQLLDRLGFAFAVADNSRIEHIFKNAVDGRCRDISAALITDSLFGQEIAKALRSIALKHALLKDKPHDLRLIRNDLQIINFLIALVRSSSIDGAIAVRDHPAGVVALFGELTDPRLGTDRGLDALTGCLLIADVVQELVHMGIKPLLSLGRAPYLNAILDKPLYNKRRLVVAAA